MKKRFNLRSVLIMLVALIAIAGVSSCSKDTLHASNLSATQLVSGRLDGTWTTPTNIVTPATVPADIFGSMRLVFTTQKNGDPLKFIAHDCPIIFDNATAGTWAVTSTADSTRVKLTGVGPVDDFSVKVSSNFMTISFYMGWENTDTKATGKGNFKVTLARQ